MFSKKKTTGRRVQVISAHGQAWRDDSDDEYEDDYPIPDVSKKRRSTQSGRCMICQTVYKADDGVKKHTCVMCQMKICSRCCSGVDPVCTSCVPSLGAMGSDKQVISPSKIVFRNPMELINKPSKSPDRGPSKSPGRGPPPSPVYNKPRSPPKSARAPPKLAPSLPPPKAAPKLPPPSKPAGFLKTPPGSPPKTSPKSSSVFSVFGRKSPRGDAAPAPAPVKKSPPPSPLPPAKNNSSPKLRGLEAKLQQLMASTAGRNPTIDERNRIKELMLQVKEEEGKNKTSKSAAPVFSLGGNKSKAPGPPAFSAPTNKPKWAPKAAPPVKKPSKWNQNPKAAAPGKPSWAQKSKAVPPKKPPTFQPPKKAAPPPKKTVAPMKKFNSAPVPPKKKTESSFLKSILTKSKKTPAKPQKRGTKTFKLGMNKADPRDRGGDELPFEKIESTSLESKVSARLNFRAESVSKSGTNEPISLSSLPSMRSLPHLTLDSAHVESPRPIPEHVQGKVGEPVELKFAGGWRNGIITKVGDPFLIVEYVYNNETQEKKFALKQLGTDALKKKLRPCQMTFEVRPSAMKDMTEKEQIQEKLNKILDTNKVCADCTSEKPNWASLNLGVVICSNCAGVHRNMGVHISQVRSLTLDEWTMEMVDGIKVNTKVNSILEFNVPPEYVKPHATSKREVFEKYINAKYVDKKFEKRADIGANPPKYDNGNRRMESNVSQDVGMIEYNGVCLIHIRNCQFLPNADFFSESDPYVIVTNGEFQKARTKHVQNDNNPTFNELVNLTVQERVPIKVFVFHKKRFLQDVVLAEGQFMLDPSETESYDIELSLRPGPQFQKHGKDIKIFLSVTYTKLS